MEAQERRNEAIKLAAIGKAAARKLEATGEADAIREVADARKYEIDQLTANEEMYLSLKGIEIELERLRKWDGSYPTTLMQLGGGESEVPLLLTLPATTGGE